ncbi:hypothetical protein CSAL01_11075 [Colletotrichum salicis]|uniref:Uncharacterized protein n=1 Tax=Colletotrichum salicis TaxID=1209931 RepID=A0A135SGL9_9PEZI|nr:hypothetical protein CSAL01_11075 [Colletotrichum salicis]
MSRAWGLPADHNRQADRPGCSHEDLNDEDGSTSDDESEWNDLQSEGLEGLQDPGHDVSSGSPRLAEDGQLLYAGNPTLQGLTLRLLDFLVTEEFEDGQAKSTLLIYFSGVLGLSVPLLRLPSHHRGVAPPDPSRLCRLPCKAPSRTTREAEPGPSRKMCLASQAPLGEMKSLLAYGRALARSDGPSFLFRWSDDGQVLHWDDGRLSLHQFKSIAQDVLQRTASAVDRLMYGWSPACDLAGIKDRMANTSRGYSFVS